MLFGDYDSGQITGILVSFPAETRFFSSSKRSNRYWGPAGLLINVNRNLNVKEAGCDPVERIDLVRNADKTIANRRLL
jgi:hypothetical protein